VITLASAGCLFRAVELKVAINKLNFYSENPWHNIEMGNAKIDRCDGTRHIAAMQLASFTAGPMTVKSSRSRLPISP